MNKQLTQTEISECLSPVVTETKPMTRYDKLMRLAEVIREHNGGVYIFHRLEYYNQSQLDTMHHPISAFALALRDPKLSEAGLKPDIGGEAISVGGAQRFFELSPHDLHEFSCDCGGAISNEGMAKRIEGIAGPKPVSLLRRVIDSTAWTG